MEQRDKSTAAAAHAASEAQAARAQLASERRAWEREREDMARNIRRLEAAVTARPKAPAVSSLSLSLSLNY